MAAAAVPSKPDYGIEAPRAMRGMFSRGAWTLLFAIVIFYVNHAEYPGPSVRILVVLGLIAAAFVAAGAVMLWSSRVGKFQVRDQILDALQLRGDERVLDLGSGRGLMLIGAARRLKNGRVTGVDLSGEADQAKENAKLEGVAEKTRVDSMPAEKLPYPDGHYDAAVSVLALRNIGDLTVRAQLVREMFRVVKPGGRLAIFDTLRTGEYAALLREAGAASVELSPVRFLWCMPCRTVTAKK